METLGASESVETARMLNDLNGATRLNDVNKYRVVQRNDRRENAGDFHDWPKPWQRSSDA